jgi:hypothetical protein
MCFAGCEDQSLETSCRDIRCYRLDLRRPRLAHEDQHRRAESEHADAENDQRDYNLYEREPFSVGNRAVAATRHGAKMRRPPRCTLIRPPRVSSYLTPGAALVTDQINRR